MNRYANIYTKVSGVYLSNLSKTFMKKNGNNKIEAPRIQKIKTKIDKPKVARRVDVGCGEGVSC